MRNPIRLKNLQLRFAPLYLAGALLLWWLRPEPVAYGVGALLIAAGAALRTWAAGHLVKTLHLTLSGPYAHLRHPLYLGTLLVGCGVAVMAGGAWAALVLAVFLPWFFLGYFPRKERLEAARLDALYGQAFRDYREAVPALVPRVAPWRPTAGDPTAGRGWSLARYSDNNELGTLLGLMAVVTAFGMRMAWASALS